MKKETERKKTINKNISSKRWGEKRRETACVNCWLGEKRDKSKNVTRPALRCRRSKFIIIRPASYYNNKN